MTNQKQKNTNSSAKPSGSKLFSESAEKAVEKEPQQSGAVNNECADVEKEIRAAEEDAKSHYDKLLRVMAEFENFKKRMTREKEELVRYGNENLLKDLLPSLDDLDRVLDHVAPDAPEDVKKIAEGVEMVKKVLSASLAKYGLCEVDSLGKPFDPSVHEAIAVVDSDTAEPNSVIAVHRKGYKLADRLLRAAMVTVSKG